jgi:hypothetical protein
MRLCDDEIEKRSEQKGKERIWNPDRSEEHGTVSYVRGMLLKLFLEFAPGISGSSAFAVLLVRRWAYIIR